jgi:hypothetical protein
MKRLSDKKDRLISFEPRLIKNSYEELKDDYSLLTPSQFGKKHGVSPFDVVSFTYKNKTYNLQVNRCTNYYCSNYTENQKKFDTVKSKPSRYKVIGKKVDYRNVKIMECNKNYDRNLPSLSCKKTLYSNLGIVNEITRLLRANTVHETKPEYIFHNFMCPNEGETPFTDMTLFYKKGKSVSNSKRFQCKSCKKTTNILPEIRESFNYHQKKNIILRSLFEDIVSKTPVRRTCEKNKISPKTYYDKLEWLNRRALEFFEKVEVKRFSEMKFKELWINVDYVNYKLNNIRRKGKGGKYPEIKDDRMLSTSIFIAADLDSRYVFASDVAYDWFTTLDELEIKTDIYKLDHLPTFARYTDNLQISSAPNEPTEKDNQSYDEYIAEEKMFTARKNFIDGIHITSTYTAFARLWWLKAHLNCNNWRFVSDNDNSLINPVSSIFQREFSIQDAHYFICKLDKTKSRESMIKDYHDSMKDLREWKKVLGIAAKNKNIIAERVLLNLFSNEKNRFYKKVSIGGAETFIRAQNPIEHPLAYKDQGYRTVECITDYPTLNAGELAHMVSKANTLAADVFISTLRRRISILERPLSTARGDGRSYIYANFNPKYAQYSLNLYRFYYNYCLEIRTSDGRKLTPAQRLGITNKKYEIEDLIYLS